MARPRPNQDNQRRTSELSGDSQTSPGLSIIEFHVFLDEVVLKILFGSARPWSFLHDQATAVVSTQHGCVYYLHYNFRLRSMFLPLRR